MDTLYNSFDDRIKLYDVYKVESINDVYMVASGLPHRNKDHPVQVAKMAMDLLFYCSSNFKEVKDYR